jgi:hypothetical protein
VDEEQPYRIALRFSPGDQTRPLPCLHCRALRRFEVLTAEWEAEWADKDYSRIEREGEVIVEGKPPADGMTWCYHHCWFLTARCTLCGLATKLNRLYSDGENWYEWFVPSDEPYDPSNRNIFAWSFVEYHYGPDKIGCYLQDPSDFFIEITDENRWLMDLGDAIEADSERSA